MLSIRSRLASPNLAPWEYNFDSTVVENERTMKATARKIAGVAAREATMKTGDSLRTTKVIRSQKTGVLLPRRGTFVRDIENLGRTLILVDFGSAGKEYLFPDEVLPETQDSNFCADKQDDLRSFQSGFEHCAL